MARRSDHTRAELEAMIVAEGHRQMEAVGFARFSAREVAKRIGYSVGTLYNVFGSYDRLVLAINGRTLALWARELEERLAAGGTDRLECLVRGYFEFACAHRNAWTAIYDHHLPAGEAMPASYTERVEAITGIMLRELREALPDHARDRAPPLARSLLASVHGHCVYAMNGSFALLGEAAPVEAAMARVREAVAAASA